MIPANCASCHCLQKGHWKSLAMMNHTVAVLSPMSRPRSAQSLMLSRGGADGARLPFAEDTVAAAGFCSSAGFEASGRAHAEKVIAKAANVRRRMEGEEGRRPKRDGHRK